MFDREKDVWIESDVQTRACCTERDVSYTWTVGLYMPYCKTHLEHAGSPRLVRDRAGVVKAMQVRQARHEVLYAAPIDVAAVLHVVGAATAKEHFQPRLALRIGVMM